MTASTHAEPTCNHRELAEMSPHLLGSRKGLDYSATLKR